MRQALERTRRSGDRSRRGAAGVPHSVAPRWGAVGGAAMARRDPGCAARPWALMFHPLRGEREPGILTTDSRLSGFPFELASPDGAEALKGRAGFQEFVDPCTRLGD